MNKPIFTLSVILLLSLIFGSESLTYQQPPDELNRIIDTPKTPFVKLSPDNKWLLLQTRPPLPSIEELAQPELKLAGHRINPLTNGISQPRYTQDLTLMSVESGEEYDITGMPRHPKISHLTWAANGSHAAFTHTAENGIELWVVAVKSKKARRLTDPILNEAFGRSPFVWLKDGKKLIVNTVLKDRGPVPVENLIPDGPTIQSSHGVKAPARTYQNLLTGKHDEALFEYYFTGQLQLLDLRGRLKSIGEPRLFRSFSFSPNEKFLLVSYNKPPYSYLVPSYRFPRVSEVWTPKGKLVTTVADLPLAENIPIHWDAVRTGPRYISWRRDMPAVLVWAEALDEGDPGIDMTFRDELYYWNAPFTDDPVPWQKLEWRYGGIAWGNSETALIYENWYKSRQKRVWILNPDTYQTETEALLDINTEDRYADPGNPEYELNNWGRWVLAVTKNKELFLYGDGAGPEGEYPFIDRLNLKTRETERLWQCEKGAYEYAVNVVDKEKLEFVTRRENPKVPGNYCMRNISAENPSFRQITQFDNPFPNLAGIQKEIIKYQRDDGIDLSGTLFLPSDYSVSDGPLPVLMWAYPTDFKSVDAAGQMQGSPDQFIWLSHWAPAIWVTQGFAVFDDPAMPIVGEGDTEPNDSFIPQLVSSAQAAVDVLVDRGVADSNRIFIGGHSYGAFMTANLLAHTDLFAGGIARSGAYNRTLTPFGFQAEQRTFWDAPDVYITMSPFRYADKINEPLLLIHGANDSNSGTYPMQSERLFNAIKGNGGTTRLVMLPYEGHGYKSRESVGHMLWEMSQWLNPVQTVENK